MDISAQRRLVSWTAAIFLVAMLAGPTLTGCDSGPAETGTDDVGGASLTLTDDDNDGSFTVNVGDTITVMLEGNPTTGYTWESDMDDADSRLLTMVGNEPLYAQTETDSQLEGVGGTFTFTFEALAPGQVELRLKYWRPFEAEAGPLETFTADLTIE